MQYTTLGRLHCGCPAFAWAVWGSVMPKTASTAGPGRRAFPRHHPAGCRAGKKRGVFIAEVAPAWPS